MVLTVYFYVYYDDWKLAYPPEWDEEASPYDDDGEDEEPIHD